MTDEQLSALVKETAERTAEEVLRRTFLTLGIDMSNPSAIVSAQADMQHLRAWRNSVETVKRQGLLSAIGIIVAGIIGLVWTAVKVGPPSP